MACWLGPGKEVAQCAVGHQRRVGRVLNPAPRYGVGSGRLGTQEVEIVVTIVEAVIGVAVRIRKQEEGVVDAILMEVLKDLRQNKSNEEVRDEGADGEDSAGVM